MLRHSFVTQSKSKKITRNYPRNIFTRLRLVPSFIYVTDSPYEIWAFGGELKIVEILAPSYLLSLCQTTNGDYCSKKVCVENKSILNMRGLFEENPLL